MPASQAGRRGFEPRLPLHFFNNLERIQNDRRNRPLVMCGIVGYLNLNCPAPPEATLERMTTRIAHRGPDDCRFYHDQFAHLGHRRLSIIDLSGGHQPMTNETGDLWIIYNGEIFNHADVRPELEKAGHVYSTHCDTEMVLHAYEQYGVACVERFRGMFA